MTGWVDCMEQQPNRGDKVVVVFANGGLKAFEVKTVPLSEHAIAWIKLPRIPRNVIANQAENYIKKMEGKIRR